MDFSLITAAVGGAANTVAIARAALEVRDFTASAAALAKANHAMIDLQQRMLDLQAAYARLQQENAELRARLHTMADARDRYRLAEIAPGVFVMQSIAVPHAVEPPHYACQPCFDQGRRAVLQKRHGRWECPACGKAVGGGGGSSLLIT